MAAVNGFDLYLELQNKVNLLDTAIKALSTRGRKYAQAEHDYKVSLAQHILLKRDKGVPVTIISDLCRGEREVARLRLERDVAEASYKAAMEAINSYKLQIRILENQIQREWGR